MRPTHTAKIIPFPTPSRPDGGGSSGAARPVAVSPVETKDERLARLRVAMAEAAAASDRRVLKVGEGETAEDRAMREAAERALWRALDRHEDAIWLNGDTVIWGNRHDCRGVCWPILAPSGRLNRAAVKALVDSWRVASCGQVAA